MINTMPMLADAPSFSFQNFIFSKLALEQTPLFVTIYSVALILLVLSGLAIWKPVQLYWLAAPMGDYEGARLLHFFAMAAVVFIVVVHVVMVALVPRSFPTMITGRARRAR